MKRSHRPHILCNSLPRLGISLTASSNLYINTFDNQGEVGAPMDSLSSIPGRCEKKSSRTTRSTSSLSRRHGTSAAMYRRRSPARIDGKKSEKSIFKRNVLLVLLHILFDSPLSNIRRSRSMHFQRALAARHNQCCNALTSRAGWEIGLSPPALWNIVTFISPWRARYYRLDVSPTDPKFLRDLFDDQAYPRSFDHGLRRLWPAFQCFNSPSIIFLERLSDATIHRSTSFCGASR
jgi:hypothetical protein